MIICLYASSIYIGTQSKGTTGGLGPVQLGISELDLGLARSLGLDLLLSQFGTLYSKSNTLHIIPYVEVATQRLRKRKHITFRLKKKKERKRKNTCF